MTIKEFSRLCGCNPKTIRYYDHVDLLKPVKVDSTTGYRYYDEDQALQYVKIKNLQIAGFSIEEIKGLLDADNDTVFNAFSEKIKDQEDRLRKTREIQQSYLDEVNRMKEKVSQFRKGVLNLTENYDPMEEFGISAEEYKQILDSLTGYLESRKLSETHFDYDLPSDGEQPEEEPEYLDILNNPDYEVLCEQHGWEHVREVMDRFTVPDDGKEYMLLFAFSEEKENQMSLATVLAVILARNATKYMETRKANPNFGCNVTKSEDGKNHFWVLVEKKEKE